jgi:hypothetical protein
MATTISFPPEVGNLLSSVAEEFRQEFAELTKSAEEDLNGKRFYFSKYGKELYPYFTWTPDPDDVPGCMISLKEGRLVASVDSTCILVGETLEGALYAARVGVGISSEGHLRRFIRLGPAIVYLSGKGASGLRSEFNSFELSALLSDHSVAERVIRNTLERRVVETLLASEEQLIVMTDGSLKHPLSQFSSHLPGKKNPGSCLVGFSKSSSLIFSERATSAVSKTPYPSYFSLAEGRVRTVLAKFAADGLVFRLDLAHLGESVEMTLGRILWNDRFSAGYPESLRIAHHVSVFTKGEDSALKACVTRRFRLRELPTFNLRRIALGVFSGGSKR